MMQSFLLRLLVPHLLLLPVFLARDWFFPLPTATPEQGDASFGPTMLRGLIVAAALAIAWLASLTLAGIFQRPADYQPPAPSRPLTKEDEDRQSTAIAMCMLAGVLFLWFGIAILGVIPALIIWLADAVILPLASLWLLLVFKKRVWPELQPEYERRQQEAACRRRHQARIAQINHEIAACEAELQQKVVDPGDPDRAEIAQMEKQERRKQLRERLSLLEEANE